MARLFHGSFPALPGWGIVSDFTWKISEFANQQQLCDFRTVLCNTWDSHVVHGSPLPLHLLSIHTEEGILGKSHLPLALLADALGSSVIWEGTKEAMMDKGAVHSSHGT